MNTNTNTINNKIITGDVRTELRRLARERPESVDCVVTSPPYFRLRNYGDQNQIGLESHVDGWVAELRDIFRDLRRVLKPTGSVWLSLGDSFSRDTKAGAPAKSMLLAPERLLLALAADGWIVRNKVIWAKTNPMPNSVRDRLACTHEYVYFLTRSPNYFFDLDAIRIPHRSAGDDNRRKRSHSVANVYPPVDSTPPNWAGPLAGNNSGLTTMKRAGMAGHPLGKNPGDVWTMATASFHGAHFATFPKALVERPLLAGCPERVCTSCGKPWERERTARQLGSLALQGRLKPTCTCRTDWQPGVVLDPFFGAGTVGLVAEEHDRSWIGIEVNPEFVRLAEDRIAAARPERSAA